MGQQFNCTECEHKASLKSDLVRHQKSVHMGQKFQCPDCEHQFSSKGYLVTHKKSVHMGGDLLRSIPSPKNIENYIFTDCHDSSRWFKTVWGQYL